MLDNITSLFDNYKGKIRNPFIGTIISVWLIHNWRIPFALFNFDKECTMIDKINFIADYFGKQKFWNELIYIIGVSFLILIFTFILMFISRSITDFFYKIAEPYVITKIDKNAIYTIDDKEKLEKRITNLNSKINQKDSEIGSLETSNIKILGEKNTNEKSLNDKILKSNEIINELEATISNLNEIVSPFKVIKSEFDVHIGKLTSHTLETFNKLSNEKDLFKLKAMNDITNLIYNGLIFDPNGQAKFININNYDTATLLNSDFKLTSLGRLFLKYYKVKHELPF